MTAPHTAPHVHRMPFLLYRITVLPAPLYPRYAVHRICAWGACGALAGYGAPVPVGEAGGAPCFEAGPIAATILVAPKTVTESAVLAR
jgi:hypothetical protein